MPLTKKGEEILAAMKKEYGGEKGEEVFYASRNKGTIAGVDSADARSDMSPSSFDRLRELFDEWLEEEKSEPAHRDDSRTDGEALMDSLNCLRGRVELAASRK